MRFPSNERHADEDGLIGDGLSAAQSYTMDEMQYMVRTSRSIPEELKEMVTLEIAQRAPLDQMWKNKQVRFQKGVFGGKHWAIRKGDFRLIEIITGTAVAVATFATVVGASPAVFGVTLVFAAVTGLHIFGENVWTTEKMAAALNDLKSVHLADGSTEALVAQAADGSWAVNGI